MKILIANDVFVEGGGITTYCSELIRCLSKEHELTVVLKDDSLFPIRVPSVKVLYHDTQDLSVKNAHLFIKLINEEVKPDIVIGSFALIIPIIAPFLNNNIRLMTVSHSGKHFVSDYCAVNHKYIDNIIAASSDYNKRYLEKRFHIKDQTKIKVIYNSVAFNSELESLRLEKKKRDVISIVYSGGGLPGKNPDLTLKILCNLLKTDLNFKFYWTGGSKLPLPKQIINRCKLNDVKQFLPEDERVEFVGRIPSSEDFVKFVSSANILLTPSRNEGCSMLVLQALRSGSILMVGDYLHSNKELVEKGDCGFALDHRSPETFADKLIDIISHPSEYARMYENAHDTYQRLLSYPVWETKMMSLLESATKHAKRKQRINDLRLRYDISRMKLMKKSGQYKHAFFFIIRSLCNFYLFYIKLKIKGDFPIKVPDTSYS